jgi:hypothetical protein
MTSLEDEHDAKKKELKVKEDKFRAEQNELQN